MDFVVAAEPQTESELAVTLCLLEGEGTYVVLQATQLDDDVGRHDVRPRREQLPELHERRAELVEHLTEMLAARRADARLRLGEPRLGRPAGQ